MSRTGKTVIETKKSNLFPSLLSEDDIESIRQSFEG